jgi:hypothetical protein
MRLFLMIVLAGLVSIAIGVGAVVVTSQLPTNDDAAGRGLGEVFRVLFVPAYAVVAMIAFGISAPGQRREHALKVTMIVLCLLPFAVVLFGCMQDVTGRLYRLRGEFFSGAQIVIPLWLVVLAQWLVLRWHLRRPDHASTLAGT